MHRSGASWVLQGRCLTLPVSRHGAPESGPEHCELRPEEPHLHRAQPQGRPLLGGSLEASFLDVSVQFSSVQLLSRV